jgi:hypothetical protein
MRQHNSSATSATTQLPSAHFVCSVARLLQLDPTDLLRELGYSPPETTATARKGECVVPPAPEKCPEYSDYYLG